MLGDLNGIRGVRNGNARVRGNKRFRRLLNSWPYYKLKSYIMYKANWKGIAVGEISEDYKSKTCSRCGASGNRLTQGLFKCPSCGLEINADVNGARNIRAKGYRLLAGGDVNRPITLETLTGVQGSHPTCEWWFTFLLLYNLTSPLR